MWWLWFLAVGVAVLPGAPGARVSVMVVRAGGPRSVRSRRGELAEPAQDVGEEMLAGREARGDLAGVAGQPGGDVQQPVARGGEAGPATAVAVVEPGEFLQPRGQIDGEKGGRHPDGVHGAVGRGQVAQPPRKVYA
jgi:hypothetical protein